MRKIIEALFHSWRAKVLALFLAVMLFFVFESAQMETQYLYLPVTVLTSESLVAEMSEPPVVLVSAITEKELFGTIDFRLLQLVADLSDKTEPGVYRVQVVLNNTVYLQKLEALNLSPEYITLTLVDSEHLQ